MKTTVLGNSNLVSSRLAYGCWRIAGSSPQEVTAISEARGRAAVIAAYEAGYTLFDHADIYCRGLAEKVFGDVLKQVSGMRDRILIATKCGIRFADEPYKGAPARYDFSADHILRSCDGSLKRLNIETIDLYQLHRPDYLMQPEEVAEAFDKLKQSGKARSFGVSNFTPSQVKLLQKACPMRLRVNQIELSLLHRDPLEDGTIDQCMAEHMTPLAWSPLAAGLLGHGAHRLLPSQESYRPQAAVNALDSIAKHHGCSRTVVALAWVLKHPAHIVPIVGSTEPARIKDAASADEIELSREEWYALLEAARGERVP